MSPIKDEAGNATRSWAAITVDTDGKVTLTFTEAKSSSAPTTRAACQFTGTFKCSPVSGERRQL